MSFSIISTVKAERTPRSERKRRDSFGMFDGYDSCSEESTSSSSSEDSEDEVVPSIPASLPIIKNNGQVYTYPDGKAGMGQCMGMCLELKSEWISRIENITPCVRKNSLPACSSLMILTDLFCHLHSHLRDVWDGRSARCFLLQNQALLQCVVF